MSRIVWTTTMDRVVRRYYRQYGPRFVAARLGVDDPKKVLRYAGRIGIRTVCARGKPFESVDSRRGVGKRIERK